MIHTSKDETEYFGLNIGRLSSDYPNWDRKKILEYVLAENLDLIRFTCPVSAKDIHPLLNHLGFPNFLRYISIESSMKLSKKHLDIPLYGITPFELFPYDSTKDKDVLYMLARTSMEDVADAYFDIPFVDELMPVSRILDGHARYACTYDNKLDEKKDGYIGWDADKDPLGFFLLDFNKEKHATAFMGGVLPQYRRGGLALDCYLKIIQNVLIPRGIETFSINIHLQNLANLKAANVKGLGLIPSSGNIRFNLYPMLDHSVHEPLTLNHQDAKKFINKEIEEQGFYVEQRIQLLPYKIIGSDKAILSFPIDNGKHKLFVEKILDSNNKTKNVVYYICKPTSLD